MVHATAFPFTQSCPMVMVQPTDGSAPQQFCTVAVVPQEQLASIMPQQLCILAMAPQCQEVPQPYEQTTVAPGTFVPVGGIAPMPPVQCSAAPFVEVSCGERIGQPVTYVYCCPMPAACFSNAQPELQQVWTGDGSYCFGDAVPSAGGDFVQAYAADYLLDAEAASDGSGSWAPPTRRGGSSGGSSKSSSKGRHERRQRAANLERVAGKVPAAGLPGSLAERKTLAEQLMAGLSAKAGTEAHVWAVSFLLAEGQNIVEQLAFEPAGSRVVQLALSLDRPTACAVAAKLRGLICRAIRSPHANYVVNKLIECLSAEEVPFVMQELSATPVAHAKHEYGCRIFCQLLKHAASNEHTKRLMEPVIQETRALCGHKYGHHVIEHVLEHGTPEQRCSVATSLREALADTGDVPLGLAFHRNAVFVIEKALLSAPTEDAAAIGEVLMAEPRRFLGLALSQQPQMLVRALLGSSGQQAAQAAQILRDCMADLSQDKHGRRLVEQYPRHFQRSGAPASTGEGA